MHLTPELIDISPQFRNPIGDRELDVRGNKILVIENLGTTKDQFDTIDLSDNDIRKLASFPLLGRLRTILISNNKISAIDGRNLASSLPNLETLVLNNNLLREFSQIEPLTHLKSLRTISLQGNLVTTKENYRLYVLHLLPNLRILDFKKVREKERRRSMEVFGVKTEAALSEEGAAVFTPGEMPTVAKAKTTGTVTGLTPEQIEKLKEAIAKASTVQEIQRYEQAINSGVMPPDLL